MAVVISTAPGSHIVVSAVLPCAKCESLPKNNAFLLSALPVELPQARWHEKYAASARTRIAAQGCVVRWRGRKNRQSGRRRASVAEMLRVPLAGEAGSFYVGAIASGSCRSGRGIGRYVCLFHGDARVCGKQPISTREALSELVADPHSVVPENETVSFGIADPAERDALIEYLAAH